MKYTVRQRTCYEYSQAVFLEPHVIRLHPRSDPHLQINRYALQITPTPAGLSLGIDAENNPFHLAWFDELTHSLTIASEFTITTSNINPFNSFLTCGDQFPLFLPETEIAPLTPYLARQALAKADEVLVSRTAEQLKRQSANNIILFLNTLNTFLYQNIDRVNRLEPGLQSIAQTLRTAQGACRDTTLVFIAICRHAGIPARFVSGCQEGDPDVPEAELHAWAEVYLPGFGWQGFDPTHGLAVSDRHIGYAAAALPENCAPVTGNFRGSGADSKLSHQIEMTPVSETDRII